MEFKTNIRQSLIDEALERIGQREELHGQQEDSFGLIAQYWSIYLGLNLLPSDVAKMMILFKVARSMHIGEQGFNYDNLVDVIGYAAAAGQEIYRESQEG